MRDLIRQLSAGNAGTPGMKVGVVDERSEIAACHLGIPQNDLGPRTDVLDGCKKTEGIRMLLRSMSPQILAVDELGGKEDFAAVKTGTVLRVQGTRDRACGLCAGASGQTVSAGMRHTEAVRALHID